MINRSNMKLRKPPAVIIALDLEIQKAVQLVKSLKGVEDKIAALKIGSLQSMGMGLKAAVSELRVFTSLPIIYDHQKGCTDIPEIIEKQVKAAKECSIDSMIAVPQGAGSKSLESFVQTCKAEKIEPIVLLEMTHEGANDFLREGTAKKIFDKALALGVEYFVCPGNKPEKIEEYKNWNKNIKIISPGIGAQGGSAYEAVRAGTDYPIVGRAVYEAEEPARAVKLLYKECLEGFKKRLFI